MSSGLLRVRKVANEDKKIRFTSLLHHITPETLEKSYYALQKRAVPGVDGRTWEEYREDLPNQLEGLHARIHQGA